MANFTNKIGRPGTIALVVVIASVIYSRVFGSDVDLVPKEAFHDISGKFRTLSVMIIQPLSIIALGLFIFSELFISTRIDLNKRNGVCGFYRIHAAILILLILTTFESLVVASCRFVVYEFSRYILERQILSVIWLGVVILFFIEAYPVIKYAFKRNRN